MIVVVQRFAHAGLHQVQKQFLYNYGIILYYIIYNIILGECKELLGGGRKLTMQSVIVPSASTYIQVIRSTVAW